MNCFDVVIPAHNAEKTIVECLESVQSQTLQPSKIVMVADNCTDATEQLAEKFVTEKVCIEAGSAARARNMGASQGKSPWIAFLDSDDLWSAGWLAAANECINDNPTATVFWSNPTEQFNKGGRITHTTPTISGREHLLALREKNFLCTSGVIVQRCAFEKAGGFDERFSGAGVEDYDLWVRLAEEEEFCFVPGEHVIYCRINDSAMRSPEHYSRYRDDCLQIVERAQARGHLSPPQKRRWLAAIHAISAQRFLGAHRSMEAMTDVFRGLKYSPTRSDLWGYMALSVLPTGLRQLGIELRRKWRQSRYRNQTRNGSP